MDMLVLGCLAPQNAKNWRVKPLGARMTGHDRAHTSSDTSQIVLHPPCFVWLAFKIWDADNICVLGHQTSEAPHSWGTSAYIKKRNVVVVSPRSFNHSDPSVCVFPNPRCFNDLACLGATHQKFTDGHWGFCVCCLPARNWGRLSTSKHRLACPKLYAALSTRSGQLPTTWNDLMNCVWYVVAPIVAMYRHLPGPFIIYQPSQNLPGAHGKSMMRARSGRNTRHQPAVVSAV